MKNYLFIILLSGIFLIGCSENNLPKRDYLGKSKKDIIDLCDKNRRNGKIMIQTKNGTHEYDKIEDVLKNDYLMTQKEWRLDWTPGRKGIMGAWYYYRVWFNEKDIVIKQEVGYDRDGF
jgi:hypothetical protein